MPNVHSPVEFINKRGIDTCHAFYRLSYFNENICAMTHSSISHNEAKVSER